MEAETYEGLIVESLRISQAYPSKTEDPYIRSLLGRKMHVAPCYDDSVMPPAEALALCCKIWRDNAKKTKYGVGRPEKCRRDEVIAHYLKSPEMSGEDLFEAIKAGMTKKYGMEGKFCYGSAANCCMRFDRPCIIRNVSLCEKFPDLSLEDIYQIYFGFKSELAEVFEKVAYYVYLERPVGELVKNLSESRADPRTFLKKPIKTV